MKAVYLSLFLLCAFFVTVKGQNNSYNEEITVVASYDPSISDAYKVLINPKIPELKLEKPDIEYEIYSDKISVGFIPGEIRPVRLKKMKDKELDRNYVKAGFGNYTSPYLEFFVSSRQSSEHQLNLHLKHHSSNSDISGHPYSTFSNNHAGLTYKKFFNQLVLKSALSYDRKGVSYYGVDQSFTDEYNLTESSLKQFYNNVSFDVSLESDYSDEEKIKHFTNFSYNYFADHYESSEHNFEIVGGIEKAIQAFELDDLQKLGLDADFSYFNNTDSLNSFNQSLLLLHPYFVFRYNEYQLEIGMRAFLESDTASDMYVYPSLKASLNIVPSVFSVFAGLEGGLKRNSYEYLANLNPFLSPVLPLDNSYTTLNVFGGFSASVGKHMEFVASISSESIDNFALFVTDRTSQINMDLKNKFTLIYDDVKLVHANTEINYRNPNGLSILVSGNYSHYSLDKQEEAWHQAPLDLHINISHLFSEKYKFSVGVDYFASAYAPVFDDAEVLINKIELDPYTDLNFGFTYKHTKDLSAFIRLRNLLNQEYYRWYNYPGQKLNFLAGLSYSF